MQSMLLAATKFSELKGWRWLLGFVFDQVLTNNMGAAMIVDALKLGDKDLYMANQLWDVFGVLALGLAIIGFLFELDRALLMSQGNVTMHTFFMPFVKLALCIAFISSGKELVSHALGLNNWLIDAADGISFDITDASNQTETAICDGIEHMQFMQAVLFVVPTMLFCWIASIIPGLVMYYNAIVRKLEIILRVGFSPVAFADIYKGMDSVAVQWLKKFIALGLYGMGMVVVIKIVADLQAIEIAQAFGTSSGSTGSNIAAFFTGWILPLIKVVVILFAELGACSMIKQASNEALGVR